jgi:hypothetical protein
LLPELSQSLITLYPQEADWFFFYETQEIKEKLDIARYALSADIQPFSCVCLSIPLVYHIAQSSTSSIWQATTTQSTTQAATIMSDSSHLNSSSRTPVYFLGIGGPNFMENTEHPTYAKLAEVGREITTKVKPKAVVVFSAHWQDGPNNIQINAAEQTDIIYDFYGFPPHYYEYEYPNKGSPEVAEKVIEKLALLELKLRESNEALTMESGRAL